MQYNKSKLAALNVFGAGDKMTNEWIEWNESSRIVGRLPLRANHHYHHHPAAGGQLHHGIGSQQGPSHGLGSGPGGAASSSLVAGLTGLHNNNNVSFLNNNQQSFLNSYSLNKLAAAGMSLKTHVLMKGLQKPRGKLAQESLPLNCCSSNSALSTLGR